MYWSCTSAQQPCASGKYRAYSRPYAKRASNLGNNMISPAFGYEPIWNHTSLKLNSSVE